MSSRDDSADTPDGPQGGEPDPPALAGLSSLTAVATAEHAVRLARIDDLIEQQLAAHRRVLEARDLLAVAKQGGSQQVATAREQLHQRIAAAEAAARAAVAEIEHLVDTHISQYQEVGNTIRQLLTAQHQAAEQLDTDEGSG